MTLDLDKSTWARVAFGDVIESVADRIDKPSEAGVDRYVGLEHLDPGQMTIERWDSPDKVEAQKLRFQPGDVIFGRRRAYQKKVARADFEGICSAHALVLRARQDFIDPDFLPVFLSSDYFLERAIQISVGSLSPTVNWRDLKVQKFALPPLDEQTRIADLMWAIERHRRTLNRLGDELSACQAPLMEMQSEVSVSVSNVVRVARSGATPLRSNPAFFGGSISWLKSGEVTGDRIMEAEESITEVGLAASATWLAPAGAVVVAMYGDGKTRGQVGRLGAPMSTNQAVLALVADESQADPDFLYYWLRSRQRELRSKGTGAAQKNLSKALVLSEPFPAMSVAEQTKVVRRVVDLDRARAKVSAEQYAATALSASLMTIVFGGS